MGHCPNHTHHHWQAVTDTQFACVHCGCWATTCSACNGTGYDLDSEDEDDLCTVCDGEELKIEAEGEVRQRGLAATELPSAYPVTGAGRVPEACDERVNDASLES